MSGYTVVNGLANGVNGHAPKLDFTVCRSGSPIVDSVYIDTMYRHFTMSSTTS